MELSFGFICLIVFILTFVLCKVLIKYSHVFKLIDVPNKRSMHKIEKSRAGGIAIFLAFFLGIALSGLTVNLYLLLSFLIVFLLGVYDDLFESSSGVKFFWLAVASLVLFLGDIYISSLGVFLGYELNIPIFLALLFTMFALVGFINAINLIDGLDGLSSGVGIVILLAYTYLGYKYNDLFLLYTSFLLIIALLAFLYYNWYPSKMFMGDSGSLTLGFVIGILSIHSVESKYITPVTILLLAAVPILDTLVVMLRRIRRKGKPFSPDRTHIHHIILKQQLNNVHKTTSILVLLQLIFTYIGLGFKVRDDIVILTIFILLFIFFYAILTPRKKL